MARGHDRDVDVDDGRMRSTLVAWLDGALMVVGASVVTILGLLVLLGRVLAPADGEWSMPLRVGTAGFAVRIEVGVAPLLRVATQPLGLWLLDGTVVETRHGTMRVARIDDRRLAITCSPCRPQTTVPGSAPLALDAVRIVVLRHADVLEGTIATGAITGRCTGRFDARGMELVVRFEQAPIAAYHRAFGGDVPEAAFADIAGSASLRLRLELPSGRLRIEPTIEGFPVSETRDGAARGTPPGSPVRDRASLEDGRLIKAEPDRRRRPRPA